MSCKVITSLLTKLVQSNNIIKVLENAEAQSFIRGHINDDVAMLALKYRDTVAYNMALCLQLIKIYKKAQKKLPTYWSNLLALDERSYAQCTSERVAKYKTTFLSGGRLLDLTSGLGVDNLFLARSFKNVVGLEENKDLHDLAVYNLTKLAINNVSRLNVEAISYLRDTDFQYDMIYIDPDRRSEFGRSVAIEHLSPNVVEILPILKKRTNQVYIKLSPLFDIKEVYRVFRSVKRVYLIAENGEIKEVGVLLCFDQEGNNQEIQLEDVVQHFSHTIAPNVNTGNESDMIDPPFLLAPLALVSKGNAAGFFLKDRSYRKHPMYELYFTNSAKVVGFRSFEILAKSSVAKKKITTMLTEKGVRQFNIIIKGSNEKPTEWHKKLKSKDGGGVYLFLLKGKENEAILAQLIS